MPLSDKLRFELLKGPYTRLLAEHEDAMAELYDFTAALLKRNVSFWRSLATEERNHRDMILGIDEKLRKGTWRFARPPFVTSEIAASIEWIHGKRKTMERRGISMREALRIAVELERGMIEGRYFRILDSDTPELVDVLETLANQTRAHLARVTREARRLKWRILGGRTIRPKVLPGCAAACGHDLLASIKASQADMVGLLVSLEEAVHELYNAYSQRLPDSKQFWGKLAAEEMQHATMLRTLYKILDSGKIFYNVERFSNMAIHADIDYILDATFEAKHGSLSPHKAVNTALRIENSMTESGFYKTVRSDAPEFKHVAARLMDLTDQHILDLHEEVARTVEMGDRATDEAPPMQSRRRLSGL